MQFERIKSLIFDYGGTLDTAARHWAHVLWEGYEKIGVPVAEADFRSAYVVGERTLAKQPLIEADDNFRILLGKKVAIEMRALIEAGVWTPTEDERTEAAEAVADYCYAYARRTVAHSREVLARLRPHYDMVLVSNLCAQTRSRYLPPRRRGNRAPGQ